MSAAARARGQACWMALAALVGAGCMPSASLPEGRVSARGDTAATNAAKAAGDDGACTPPMLALMTWNVMWLGDPAHGAQDDDAQLAAVLAVLREHPMDLVALQEVASITRFAELLSALPDYDAVWTDHDWPQHMALLYRRDRFALDVSTQLYAIRSAGRPPLAVTLRDARTSEPLYVVVLHAKANADQAAWLERERLSEQLAAHLAARPAYEASVVLGDFNDELSDSILDGASSPYSALLDVLEAPTMQLELAPREPSTVWGSVIDHVLLSATLDPAAAEWHAEVLRDELLTHEPLFTSRVSDHFPVTLRTTVCDR